MIIKIADPISVLVSKAIKAKEKNRILIGYALRTFGGDLAKAIERYGGDLGYFGFSEGK